MTRGKILAALGVLILECALWFFPYLLSWTENKWRWVDDESFSFLVYLVLGWGARVLFFMIPAFLLVWLISRAGRKPVAS